MLLLKGHLSPWKQWEWGRGAGPSWCHFKVTAGQETQAYKCQGVLSPSSPHLRACLGRGYQLKEGASSQGTIWRLRGIAPLLIGHVPPRMRVGS